MDIHAFTNHDIARGRAAECDAACPRQLGGASRLTRSRPSSPVCGSFAASAGAGPPLRPSRARSESRARPAAFMPASSVCHRVTRSFFVPMTNTSFRRGAKLSVPISSSVIAAMVMALAVQGAAAAPARTPDQQLVAGLRTARAASQRALSSISPASPTGAKKAATELSRAIKGIDAAKNVAARAVGALETPSVRKAVRQGEGLARQARSDVVRGRYAAARVKLRRAKALTSAALSDFGVPLEKDFPAFLTTREHVTTKERPYTTKRRACCTRLSALVGRDIVEVVIGAPDRRTANAGEAGAAARTVAGTADL